MEQAVSVKHLTSIEKDNNAGETYYEKRRFTAVTSVVKGVFTPEWFHLYLVVFPSVALLLWWGSLQCFQFAPLTNLAA